MSRNTLLFWVAILMFAAGVVSASTGILMEAVDEGDRLELGRLRLGSEFGDDLAEVHSAAGFALAGLAIVHFALNWRWMVGMMRRGSRKRTAPR
jgi:hypothetical protein